MRDFMRNLLLAGVTYGSLEYAKYRIKGGKPLLGKAKEAVIFLKSIVDEDDKQKPITLETGDYKVV